MKWLVATPKPRIGNGGVNSKGIFMDYARKYHKEVFMSDIQGFFFSLARGPRKSNIGDGIVRDPQTSFHIEDLDYGFNPVDHLAHIENGNLPFFACSLTYVILINQIVHSHFRDFHDEFYMRTRYPLVAGGLNPSRPAYDILDSDVWLKRKISKESLVSAWGNLVQGIKEDIQNFELEFQGAHPLTWSRFGEAAKFDHEVIGVDPWGALLLSSLRG